MECWRFVSAIVAVAGAAAAAAVEVDVARLLLQLYPALWFSSYYFTTNYLQLLSAIFLFNLESMAVYCFFANILKKKQQFILFMFKKNICGRCRNQPGQQQFYPFPWGAGELQW